MAGSLRLTPWAYAAALLLGGALGLGALAMVQGDGLAYFSDDAAACANCHVMQPHYDGWVKGSHHAVATCNQCHVPQTFIAQYWAKAQNGWHHSKAFTLGGFVEPIRIKAGNLAALEANCRRCHGALVAHMPAERGCVSCHAQVGHPSPAGLGGPLAAREK